MTAKILDGRALATEIEQEIRTEVEQRLQHGLGRPGLAAILVGDHPASQTYARGKSRTGESLGFHSEVVTLPATATTEQVLERVSALNGRPDIHGILVQLPLPAQIDTPRILAAVEPQKDVDGLGPVNMGLLTQGRPGLIPATPSGVIEIFHRARLPIAGQHAVIVGRSNLVGKPLALLFLRHDATVTLCHSKTPALAHITRLGDIVVAAVGRPGFLTGGMIKEGAVVIDVGITRVDGRIRGDVDRASVEPIAGYLTPVPGGVGPLTVAMLLRNTLEAAKHQQR